MKILITHAYSKENKGDAALLSVLISDIYRVFKTTDLTILTLEHVGENEKFEGTPIKHSFMYYARDRYHNIIAQTFYAIFIATYTLLWATVYRLTNCSIPLPQHLKDIVFLYRDANLIIPVGGGYIVAKPGLFETIRLFFVLHPFIFAYILGKPTINYTQSVGEFGNIIQTNMAKFVIKRLTGIIVREKISESLLTSWGVNNSMHLSSDGGFLFNSIHPVNLRSKLNIPLDKHLIGITVRNYLQKNDQAGYEESIAKFSDHCIDVYNAVIVFIPQVTNDYHDDDDRVSSQRVYGFMKNKEDVHVMTGRYDHYEIKAMYSELDYLIGTRFHSVIFSLTSYIPAIAIGYEHKTKGIMQDLGLSSWVLDIRTVDANQLILLFEILISERDSYINHLTDVLPPYIERAQHSIDFVKKLYLQYQQGLNK